MNHIMQVCVGIHLPMLIRIYIYWYLYMCVYIPVPLRILGFKRHCIHVTYSYRNMFLVEDWSISSASELEIPQSCTKPSIFIPTMHLDLYWADSGIRRTDTTSDTNPDVTISSHLVGGGTKHGELLKWFLTVSHFSLVEINHVIGCNLCQ